MADMVDLGFFRRAGENTEGLIGPLRVLFDRHRGGVATLTFATDESRATGSLSVPLAACPPVSRVARADDLKPPVAHIEPRSGATLGPVRLAARVRLLKDGQPIWLRQEADPDPRLIIAEQGPIRIWMRVMFSLLDESGNYHGDGLTETILYNDGEVRLAFCLRLVDSFMHDTVTDAWIEMDVAGDVTGGRIGAKRLADLPRDKENKLLVPPATARPICRRRRPRGRAGRGLLLP